MTDLFLVGLALDVTGAWLLAKGLLISALAISRISATLWGGNPETAHDRCANRVDAEFGLTYLAAGFLLQAIGYSLEIAGVETGTGGRRLLAALTLSLVVAALAVVAYYSFHVGRVERLISETEAEDGGRQAAYEERQEAGLKARETEAGNK